MLQVFHAGTGRDKEGRLVAQGGRVLAVTATGTDVAEAQRAAYKVWAIIFPPVVLPSTRPAAQLLSAAGGRPDRLARGLLQTRYWLESDWQALTWLQLPESCAICKQTMALPLSSHTM